MNKDKLYELLKNFKEASWSKSQFNEFFKRIGEEEAYKYVQRNR